MTTRASYLLLLGSCSMVSACDDPPIVASPRGSTTVALLAEGFCGYLSRCCTLGELNRIIPFAGDTQCAERLVEYTSLGNGIDLGMRELLNVELELTLPNPGALQEALDDGRVKVDPDALTRCLEHLESLECAEAPPEPEGCQPPEPFPEEGPCVPELLFVGRLREGDACTSAASSVSLECAPGLTCRSSGMFGVQGRCAPFSPPGGACYDNGQCQKDLYCSLVDGTCQPYRQLGESCVALPAEDPFADPTRGLLLCDTGLACDPVTDTCVAPCGLGASCATDDDCDADQDLRCVAGRCDHLRAEGQRCTLAADCEPELTCGMDPFEPSQSVCLLPLDIGSPCAAHSVCDSGFCDPDTGECSSSREPGEFCPSGEDAECDAGRCVAETAECSDDEGCPLSGSCDTESGRCASYCVELVSEGDECDADPQCLSGQCVAGRCRTLPLEDGTACELDAQCDSGFCGPGADGRCAKLPLALGDLCTSSDQCESGVCYFVEQRSAAVCVAGLAEGQPCAGTALPCDPNSLYCDVARLTPVCARLKEGGEMCVDSTECRGECQTSFSRSVCSLVAPEGAAVCDGVE